MKNDTVMSDIKKAVIVPSDCCSACRSDVFSVKNPIIHGLV
jgi:hypothetical protein